MENSVFQKEVESHIVLGYKCNHNCMHCVVKIKRIYSEEKNTENLSKDEAMAAVETAIEKGATKIVFTGGEPTLREDLPCLVLYCIEKGCGVQIQTNGSMTEQIKEICSCCAECSEMLEFMIPIHSTNAERNDYICRSNNGFKQARESIEFIARAGVKIIGKIVLTKFTDNLSDICKFYEEAGASSIIVAYPHCVSFPVDIIRKVDLKREDTRKIFEEFYQNEFSIPIILQAFPRCFVGEYSNIIIQEEQEDYLALEILEHQFRTEDGKKWHTFRKLDKRKFTNCPFCKYNDNCEGIWKDYIKAYGN